MTKFKIGNRLKLIAELSKNYSRMADIGTDHGYLPYYLFENHSLNQAILCDINSGPLDNAKKTFSGSMFSEQVAFRLGSGIEPLLSNEVDHVVIAGMGGGLIIDILSFDLSKTKSYASLLLQPMTEQSNLREWLIKCEMIPFTDYFTNEGKKFYEVIHVGNTNDKDSFNVFESSSDLEFGYRVPLDNLNDYMAFLRFKENKYKTILKKAHNHDDKKVWCNEKLSEITKIVNSLRSDYNDYIR